MDKPIDEFMKVCKYVNSSMIDAINNNGGSIKFNTENNVEMEYFGYYGMTYIANGKKI